MVSSWPPFIPPHPIMGQKTGCKHFPFPQGQTLHPAWLCLESPRWHMDTTYIYWMPLTLLGLSLTYFTSGKAPGIWGLEFISSTSPRQCSGSLVERPNLELITSFCWCRVSKPGTIDTLGQKILCWGHCRMDGQQHP